MPPIRNQGGDDTEVEVDPSITSAPEAPDAAPAVEAEAPVAPVPEAAPVDDSVRLQLANAFGDGDTFVYGEYIVKTTPTKVPPEVADEIVAAALSAGVQVVNIDQEG